MSKKWAKLPSSAHNTGSHSETDHGEEKEEETEAIWCKIAMRVCGEGEGPCQEVQEEKGSLWEQESVGDRRTLQWGSPGEMLRQQLANVGSFS